jgi:ribosome recycling factor
MSDTRKKLDELVNTVRKERDELKLQIHLASLDAKDEYERLSKKCDRLADEYQPVTEAVEKTADNMVSALGMVADELKFGFQRVRQAISETKE